MMDVKVFPNPNDGFFTLSFESTATADYNMIMTDVTGRVVYNENGRSIEGINHVDYNFSSLPKGVYMVHIRQLEDTQVLKVVLH